MMSDLSFTISFDELSAIYGMEKDSDTLQALPANYRQAVKAALDALQLAKRSAPDIDQALIATDELREYKLMLQGIATRRFRKIIDLAVLDALGIDGGAERCKHLSPYEKSAYNEIKDVIHRVKTVIDPGGH